MIRSRCAALAAALLLAPLGASAAPAAKRIDLNTPEGANAAARRTQCSDKDGEHTVYWFHGEGFARVPGRPSRARFGRAGQPRRPPDW